MSRSLFIVSLSFFTLLFSCKQSAKHSEQKGNADTLALDQGTYFSIREFAADQFRTYWGQPFTLEKIVIENGEKDSSLVPVSKIDWAKALKPFFDADIADAKFLNQYSFTELNDDATVSKTYYYEAKNEKLFTRNLQIVTDPFTGKIKSIFIETEKNGKTQKLYYKPVKLIQIQEYESSFLGKDKNIRIEYRFLY